MKINVKKRIIIVAGLILLMILSFTVFWQMQEVEVSRTDSPDGNYIAVVSYRRFHKPFASLPGHSSDHPGYLSIQDKSGKSYGKATLPLIWMADDLSWEDRGARLVGAGTWDFHAVSFEPWD